MWTLLELYNFFFISILLLLWSPQSISKVWLSCSLITCICGERTNLLFQLTFNGISVYYRLPWSVIKNLTALHFSGSFRPKTISARNSSGQLVCFYRGSSDRTAFFGNNYDLGTSIEVEMTVSEYHNQKRVLHSKGLQGNIKIERNARKYHQSNKLTGSITNKSTAR